MNFSRKLLVIVGFVVARVLGETTTEFCKSPSPILTLDIAKQVNDPIAGDLYKIYIKKQNEDFAYIGPLAVWSSGGKVISITGSISELNEILHREQVLKTNANETALVQTLILRLCNVDDQVFFPIYRNAYILQLKAKFSGDQLKTYCDTLTDPEFVLKADSWQFTFVVLTRDGGIERKKFSGKLHPISVTKLETELVIAGGVIPAFDFTEWQREQHPKE